MIRRFVKMLLPQAFLKWHRQRQRNKIMRDFQLEPQSLAVRQYERVFKERPDIENPQNLIEKIFWLQFNSDTSLWTLCADKYRVRKFVEEKGLGKYLCKLYGVWEKADDIDFGALPRQFVLKTNNSCGQIIIVKDKATLDIELTKKKLSGWLVAGYGYDNAQIHYTRIKPCIIAEELLPSEDGHSLVDYKIWCFSGKPECVLVCYDRFVGGGGYSLSMFDTKWNNISKEALNPNSKHFNGASVSCPKNYKTMLDIASILSADFPEVRVDFYNIDGRIVFGELTFTTGYGSYNMDFYKYLGSKVKLPK